MEKPEATCLETVHHFVERAAERLAIPDDVLAVIQTPYREVTVQIPVKVREGKVRLFYGYRVQHNGARGPYKGGLRYHEQVDLDEVRAMASVMSWKTALVNIPFGGAKGGINCSPEELSQGEVERVTRSFMDKIRRVLGPMRDIMAPDLNTDSQVMAWLMDEYGKFYGHTPEIVTGKPVSLGGSRGREEAPARGLVYLFREAAPGLGLHPSDTTVVIQGFGQVGSWTARIMQQFGCTIVGLSDVHGAIHNPKGIDAEQCYRFVQEGGTLPKYPDAEEIDPDDLFSLKCDVLVPAAVAGVINEHSVDRLNCRMVLEAANTPTTPIADAAMEERGIFVMPDVMANAGGVIVSYFEWVQNLQHVYWDEREVNSKLGTIMRRAYRELQQWAGEKDRPLRAAAYELGIKRVVEAAETRGYI